MFSESGFPYNRVRVRTPELHTPVWNLTEYPPPPPPGRQAIIWTNAGILLIGPLGTNFYEILTEIHIFSFKKMHLKMLYGKWRPFNFGLSVLILKQGNSFQFSSCVYDCTSAREVTLKNVGKIDWYQNKTR